jgi:Mce-associated membrane protein
MNRRATTTVTAPDTVVEMPAEPQDGEPAESDDSSGMLDIGETHPEPASSKAVPNHVRLALVAGTGMVSVLAALAAWTGHHALQSHQAEQFRAQVLSTAERVALNLTTISWQQADADIQRILDGAVGSFHDDFAQRAPQFVEVVKQAKSTSSGAITAAGVESQTSDEAAVLVTVNVKTSDAAVPEPSTRLWRMRLVIHSTGDQMKVSKVDFVA